MKVRTGLAMPILDGVPTSASMTQGNQDALGDFMRRAYRQSWRQFPPVFALSKQERPMKVKTGLRMVFGNLARKWFCTLA